MLPIPTDPDFKVPESTEEDFFNPQGEEDESLLATGAWDDIEDQDGEDGAQDSISPLSETLAIARSMAGEEIYGDASNEMPKEIATPQINQPNEIPAEQPNETIIADSANIGTLPKTPAPKRLRKI